MSTRDIKMWALVARLEAQKTLRAGMEAHNADRARDGWGGYEEGAFIGVFTDIEKIAAELELLANEPEEKEK